MAEIPVLVFFGDSNMSGLANLDDVTAVDFDRWTGDTWSTQTWPVPPAGPSDEWPKDVDVPDVKALSINIPHEPATTLTISAVTQINLLVTDAALSDSAGDLLITSVAHGFEDDDVVHMAHSGLSYPVAGLSARTKYYASKISADTFKLSTTRVAAPTYIAYSAPPGSTTFRFATCGITVSETTPFAATDLNAWVFVSKNTTGYGQPLRIIDDPSVGSANKCYVVDPLSYNESVSATYEPYSLLYAGNPIITITADGELELLEKSHTIHSATTNTTTDQTVIVKKADTPVFNASLAAGDWVALVGGNSFKQVRRVVSRDSNTQITVAPGITTAALKGDGIRELLAANTVKGIAGLATSANFAWRALRFYAAKDTSYSAAGDYATFTSLPPACPAAASANVNGVPEATWGVKSHFNGTLYVVVEGVGGATACGQNVNDQLANSDSHISYLIDIDHNDFRPGSPNGNYGVLTSRLAAAKALIVAGGDTMNVVGIFSNVGTNDATWEAYADQYENSMGFIIDSLRDYIVDNSMTTLTADQIPFGLTTVNAPTSLRAYKETVNDAMGRLAAKPGVFVVDATDFDLGADNLHLNVDGQTAWGRAFYEGWALRWKQYLQGKRDATAAAAICNVALSYIGEKADITSLDTTVDTSVQAARCAKFYDLARDSLLNMHRWNFATKRLSMTAIENTRTEWDYAYSLPADCLEPFSVLPEDAGDDLSYDVRAATADSWPTPIGHFGLNMPRDFVVERDANGGYILYTNEENAILRYLARVNSASEYPALFREALAWHLASMLVGVTYKGTEGFAMTQRCETMFAQAFARATIADSNARTVNPAQNTPWITGR